MNQTNQAGGKNGVLVNLYLQSPTTKRRHEIMQHVINNGGSILKTL